MWGCKALSLNLDFEEARMVFYDEKAVQFFDPNRSEDEDRFLLLRISSKLRILIGCHSQIANEVGCLI